MRWFAVHHGLASNRKWIQLRPIERGAWITLLAIAAGNEPRGRFPDQETAVVLLERDGFTDAATAVATLIEERWIDVDQDGGLAMHDFDAWQLAIRKPSDHPDEIRKRVAQHRAKVSPTPPSKEGDKTKGEVTRGNALPEDSTPCPECGVGHLVERVNRDGNPFLGCDRYPDCRHAEPVPLKVTPLPDLETLRAIRAQEIAEHGWSTLHIPGEVA